jgi:hypothetical protein
MKHTVAPSVRAGLLLASLEGSRRPGASVCCSSAPRRENRNLGAGTALARKLGAILGRPKFSQSFLKLNGLGLTGTSRVWLGPQNLEYRMVS